MLPFENLTSEKDDAFFADGIQDDVLTTLGKVKQLTVIARASVMNYRGAALGGRLREIGKTLGVSHVLAGSVRRSANRVVVNVQLIDTRDDHQLWSEHYDRTLTDSIGLQGELATEIAHALRVTLDPGEKARLATKPTNNPEAYVLYLKARDKERTVVSNEDNIAVDRIYDQAITLDPKFAVAIARQSLWNTGMYYGGRSQEQKTKAHALAMEALRIAPDLPEAHIALGEWFRLTERNYDADLKELLIAAQTIPNDPELLDTMGALYRRQGRWREALANFRRAQELDPRVPHEDVAGTAAAVRDWPTATVLYRHLLEIDPHNIDLKMNFASVLMNGAGDFAAARAILNAIPYPRRDASGNPSVDDVLIRWELLMLERDFAGAEKVLVEFPLEEFPPPLVGLKNFYFARTAWARGDQDRARERFEKGRSDLESIVRDHPDDPMFVYGLGMVNAYLGRKEEALRESRRAIDLVPTNDAVERPRYLANLALVYALTGETEKAITLLEQLLTTPTLEGSGVTPITLTQLRGWKWDSLRSNPRFQKILAGTGAEDGLLEPFMAADSESDFQLAIGHVLFIDIVGYSRLTTREQNAAVATLNQLVQSSEPFQIAEKAGRLLKIPTGDGMALVFSSSPEEPVQCAVALTGALKSHPDLHVRMGIHSGSVSGVVDVTGRANVAGAGINIAQRVMDCADAGHILISKHAADDLAEYERWRPLLHDLGPCEVKHGVKVPIVNLWNEEIGHSRVPTKLKTQRIRVRRRRLIWLGAVAASLAVGTSAFLLWRARENARVSNLTHSVAVLPFESLSANPDNAIFADGVHREVLSNLAKIADLKVISRTSVMHYKSGTDRNLKQIADELGVNYVVEGSVQREASHIHVTVELIDARTDTQAWAENYDGNLSEVLLFQSEIAQRISNQLGAKLSPREITELASRPTQDIAAFESYIRARTLIETRDFDDEPEKFVEDNVRAVQLLEQAVARDPKFAGAYWALTEANIQLYRAKQPPNLEYRARAEAALREAQRLAPEAGETYYAQSRVTYYGVPRFYARPGQPRGGRKVAA